LKFGLNLFGPKTHIQLDEKVGCRGKVLLGLLNVIHSTRKST